MEPSIVILLITIGCLIGGVIYHSLWGTKPAPKATFDVENQILSLRAALNEVNQLLAKKSEMKISRIENRDLFDRLENLEKADKTLTVIRHEHFHTQLTTQKEDKNEKNRSIGSRSTRS